MSTDVYSFSTPCLRWKILAGIKNHYGFPGNVNTANRYLTLTVTQTVDETPLGPNFPINTKSQTFTIDRYTGLRTPADLNQAAVPLLNFPYNSGLPGSDDSPGSTWTLSETDYTHVVTLPTTIIVTTQATLSNQYTLEMLDADASALIAQIDADAVPWFELFINTGGDVPVADPTAMLPAQYMYGGPGFIFTQNPIPLPPPPPLSNLKAVAWYALSLGSVGQANWSPNVYMKAIGYVALAGKYCEKIFLIDYNQNPLSNECRSIQGKCSEEFEIDPPPLVFGQNAYVLIVPNCVCGQ